MSDRKRNERIAVFDNSEVMANFVKIAYDSGIIEMEEDGSDPVDVKGLETADKDTLDEKYNVHPGPDEDGRDLVDRAHPDKVNILDSYLNGGGVVENGQEAQDIDVQVARKKPYYNDVHHREIAVATTELVNQLVLVADEMDVRDQQDIVSFADSMIVGINKSTKAKKKINKEAGAESLFKNPKVLSWVLKAAGITAAAVFVGREIESDDVLLVDGAIDLFTGNLKAFLQSKSGVLKVQADIIQNLIANLDEAKTEYLVAFKVFQAQYEDIENAIDKEDEKEVASSLEEFKKAHDNLAEALTNVKKQYDGKVLDQKSINILLDDMSTVKKESGSSAWENLFDHTKKLLDFIRSSEAKNSKNALTKLNQAVDAELAKNKRTLELAYKLVQQFKIIDDKKDDEEKISDDEKEPNDFDITKTEE